MSILHAVPDQLQSRTSHPLSDLTSSLPSAEAHSLWQMPVVPENYDRGLELSADEFAAVRIYDERRQSGQLGSTVAMNAARVALARFERCLHDIVSLHTDSRTPLSAARDVLYHVMYRRNQSFWAWSKSDWVEILMEDCTAFDSVYGPKRSEGRLCLYEMAYLVCGVTDLRPVSLNGKEYCAVHNIFGRDLLDAATAQVLPVLVGLGYQNRAFQQDRLRNALAQLFLLNRNPYLTELSAEVLQVAIDGYTDKSTRTETDRVRIYGINHIGIALHHLNYIKWTSPGAGSTPRVDHTVSETPEGGWSSLGCMVSGMVSRIQDANEDPNKRINGHVFRRTLASSGAPNRD
jgi:hypothetical protein